MQFTGEEWQLSRVLTNLLDNAFKYVPAGGRIEVTLETQAYRPILTVSENGPGIATGERDRIFERFYRGGADEGDVAGSGLGLALAQAIAERHGLTLQVIDSKVGSTFRLS